MTATPASLKALEASARKRSGDVEARIERALKSMRKRRLAINISSLAREAGVSRSVIHRRPELREKIRNLQPLTPVDVDDPPPPAADTENSIITALRTRLKTRDSQIAELKDQLRERDHIIATLHGELARKL
ncbi:transposase [Mycolicibacterium septicum]|nr:transposase [Mycolicibacterium septicum]